MKTREQKLWDEYHNATRAWQDEIIKLKGYNPGNYERCDCNGEPGTELRKSWNRMWKARMKYINT